jgi:hypothetical protein
MHLITTRNVYFVLMYMDNLVTTCFGWNGSLSGNTMYSNICNIRHLRDQRFAGYHNFLDIRILYLICISFINLLWCSPRSSLLHMSVFAFIINTALFHVLPAPVTKMKYSRYCTVTGEGNKATPCTTLQCLTTTWGNGNNVCAGQIHGIGAVAAS